MVADAARKEAHDLRHDIRKNIDPMAVRDAAKNERLFRDLAEDYMERHALKHKRPTSIRNDRQMLDRIILSQLGRHRLSAIARRDIEALHSSLHVTPYRANRVLALLSSIFNKAVEWQWLESNPVVGVERYQEQERDTWLGEDDLIRLETALREYEDQEAADAIRLLIVTGARN